MPLKYRVMLLCREGSCLVGNCWMYIWRWHTWTIEDSWKEAIAEADKHRGFNPQLAAIRVVGVDQPFDYSPIIS